MNNFLTKAISEPKKNLTNWHLWKYHVLSFIDNRIWSRPTTDSFNWRHYKEHYLGELEILSRMYCPVLRPGDYAFAKNKLTKINKGIKPLHPNWELLYEVILQLKPKTVLEVGCGGGMHLHNLRILNGNLSVFGVDRSSEQLSLVVSQFPILQKNVSVLDITKNLSKLPKYDLVFTQAVLMHLTSSEADYLQALVNIFNQAQNQVVFVEKWTKHPLLADIKKLHKTGKIRWSKIYFYYFGSHPRIMICSKLKLHYPKLLRYNSLTDNT